MKRLSALAALCLLTACVEAEPPAEPPQELPATCPADQFKGLVGQSETVLRGMMLPAGTRVIGPRDPVTMDFRQERMNFEIGEDGRIAKIACY